MPSLSPRSCTWPGCDQAAAPDGGPCAAHRRAQDRRRGKTAERGYDAAHRRLRESVLAEFPVCQLRLVCEGAVATDLDHIVPIERRRDLRLVRSNVQASCSACNVEKARRMHRKSAKSGAKSSCFVGVAAGAVVVVGS